MWASARSLGVWGHAPPSAFGRAAASPQTRQMRCWPSSERTTNPSPSSERTTNPSSRRKRQDSLSLSLVLFPPKPLRWVSAGALLWEVIKLPFCIFGISMWGWYHYPLAALSVSEQPRAGFISAEKRFSQSGCSAPTNALFPPAHSAFWALLCGGGITTLGVRFMPLKRWARRSYGGVFAVLCRPGARPVRAESPLVGYTRHPSP